MKVVMTVTIDVDVDAWRLEYGISKEFVPEDARSYVGEQLTSMRALENGLFTKVDWSLSRRSYGYMVVVLVAVTVAAVLVACGGGGKTTAQSMAAWSTQMQNDPAYTAVNNEISSTDFSTDPTGCRLAVNDSQALAQDHPRSPVDETDWSQMLAAQHTEVVDYCKSPADLNGGVAAGMSAISHLGAFIKAVQAQVPGFSMGG